MFLHEKLCGWVNIREKERLFYMNYFWHATNNFWWIIAKDFISFFIFSFFWLYTVNYRWLYLYLNAVLYLIFFFRWANKRSFWDEKWISNDSRNFLNSSVNNSLETDTTDPWGEPPRITRFQANILIIYLKKCW